MCRGGLAVFTHGHILVVPEREHMRVAQRVNAAILTTFPIQVCTANELELLRELAVERQASSMEDMPYFEVPLRHSVFMRFPWLFSLMLVQSVSGFVVESFNVPDPTPIRLPVSRQCDRGGGVAV